MLKLTCVAAVAWCVSIGVASLPLHAQSAGSRAPVLPDGPGKSLVATLCDSCHTLEVSLDRRGTADDWRGVVRAMNEVGARISAEDAATIASYLGTYFGPAPTASKAAAKSPSPAAPGKDILAKKCFQCHSASMFGALRTDRRGWEGVLYRMVGRGALWTEEEIGAMADYLVRVAGKPSN